MPRRNFFNRPAFYLTSLSVAAPLAAVVAASCTADEASSLRAKMAAEAASIYVDPASLSNDLKWIYGRNSAAFSEFSGIGSFLYLSGYYPDLANAKAAPASAWSLVPPKSISYDHTQRFLWLKVTFRSGDLGDDDFHYFDITKSSGVQGAITAVSNIDSANNNILRKITLDIVNDQFVIDESAVELPVGAKLVYTVANSPWVGREAAERFMNRPNNYRYDVLFGLVVKIIPSDIQKYSVITNGTIRITPNITLEIDVDPEFLTQFYQIKARYNPDLDILQYSLGSATPSLITYSLPSYISRVWYRFDTAKTPDELLAISNDKWSRSVPRVANAYPTNDVHLYVKLDPQPHAKLSRRIIDITDSSGVRSAIREAANGPL